MIGRCCTLLAVAICLAFSLGVGAQDDARARDQAVDTPRFSTSSDLVVLHATVRDRSRRFVPGLPRTSFAVLEENQPQSIELFSSEDAPVTVGLLLDSSISIWSIRDLLIGGAVAFARASNPKDELFAIAFNEEVRPVLPPDAPFTSDVTYFGAQLEPAVIARGRTALFDAVAAGLDYVERGTHARQVLVVLSDGGDNASAVTFDDVLVRAQRSNAAIFTVALIDPSNQDARPRVLQALAEASGGESFAPKDTRTVAQALDTIARHIREAYTIGYTASRAPDDTFRRVRVIVTDPANQRLTVTTRRGYFASRATGKKNDDREP